MVKCNCCGAIYEPICADGMQYFHACPPLSARELKAGLADGTVQLTPGQRRAVDAARTADQTKAPAQGATSLEDLALGALIVPRPNRRDENIKSTRAEDRDSIKATGLGTVELTTDSAGALVPADTKR